MSLLQRVYPSFPAGRVGAALLAVRAFAGLALMHHGWTKIQNPFHWMDRAPHAAPAPLQFLAALSEFGGGLALIVGLATPLAAFGVLCTMVVAVSKHLSNGDPFVGRGHSWELAGVYLTVAVATLLAGPGAYSLDAVLLRSRGASRE